MYVEVGLIAKIRVRIQIPQMLYTFLQVEQHEDNTFCLYFCNTIIRHTIPIKFIDSGID